MLRWPRTKAEKALTLMMLVQAVCLAFFVIDIYADLIEWPAGRSLDLHIWLEVVANLTLGTALVVEFRVLRQLLARSLRAEKALTAAAGALNDLMESYFAEWGLTPAEADVARFTIKGCSIAEIAGLRQSAEGTVKSQLNAIYRKAGLAGRSQLVSVLIEDLLNGPLEHGPRRVSETA